MNPKSLILLEFPKVLARLKSYASFSASESLAEALRPTSSLETALQRQQETREARLLISLNDSISFQGAVDLAPLTDQTLHGIALEASDLLAVRNTLILSRTARRVLLDNAETAPSLAALAGGLSDGQGLIDLINRTISERGEVLDSASAELAHIRSEIKVIHARLMDRLNRYLTDPASARMLQENLITQRSGRYVLPLRAEHKGQIKAIIHDQSASGATLFIEPIAVVELNNKFRELELAERDEVLRVLRALSQQIALQAESLNLTTKAMAGIDLALMKAHYADDLQANEPELVPFPAQPPEAHPGSVIQLRRARHPLLDPQKVVPIDFELDRQTFSVVLTGPNTGGKTVTLKTVGLMVLMAQAGLQIPAQSGSRLSIFRDVFADIGDEQSIEQSLSTFSGHITQLVRILKHADHRSLVLLDELGAGTDPQEGSALARAVLDFMLQRRITSVVATHYPELKAYAHSTKGVTNASLEFDLETLRPTYRLVIGLPGRSNALAIADRLGLDPAIIAAARQEIDPTELHADDLLEEIHRQRNLAAASYEAAEKARKEAEASRNQINARLEQLEAEKAKLLDAHQSQLESELASLREELNTLRRELTRLRQSPEKQAQLAEIEEKFEVVEQKQEQNFRKKHRQPKAKGLSGALKVGDRVLVRKLGAEGVVSSVDGEDLELQIGALRVRAKSYEVERRVQPLEENDVPPQPAPVATGSTAIPGVNSPGLELDLRGQRVDDALDRAERYLEQGFTSGMPFGRIIHGRGTGAVRQAVRDLLDHSAYVHRWENGGEKEGGDGVSVVFFHPNK
ncbi:MAG TPA: endonuclease MutS2 [Anaerolineaceae bacterium]|nr:endonuclease MutS2 [Anaerolineaceae bacterium]